MKPPGDIEQGAPLTEEQKALYAEQVTQLYGNSYVGLCASAINSVVLVIIQRNVTSPTVLIAWVAVLAGISLLRFRDVHIFFRRSPEISEAGYWGTRFIAGLTLSGMAWGSSAVFLFPIESLAHQTFLAFVTGGMVAGAAAAFSSIVIAFLAYSVPALTPIIIRFVLLGDELHLAMGGMALLFGLMMFLTAKQIYAVRIASVKLRFENTGLVTHLAERRRMEAALQESEQRYRTLFEKSLDAVILADPSGKDTILSANPAACRMFGRTEEEMIGLSQDEILASPTPEPAAMLRERETGRYSRELMYRRADGTIFPGEVSTSLFTDSNGSLRSVAIVRDITERKRAEDMLQKAHDELDLRVQKRTADLSEAVDALHEEIDRRRKIEEDLARQAELLNLTHDAIIAHDLDNRIFFWNRGAEERYGWTSAEVKGKVTDSLLQTVFTQPREEIDKELLLHGRWEGEVVHTTREGRKIIVASRRALRRDNQGKPIALLEINSDITDRKRIEEQLRQSQKMEAVGTLAGGIAHDFNNILAAILGFGEMVEEDLPPGSPSLSHMHRVISAALRGRDLVQQILAFSRKAKVARTPVSLSALVKETVQLLRASIPATIDIRLNLKASRDMVVASPTELQQIVMNLATNASFAMRGKGGILGIGTTDIDFGPDSPVPDEDLEPGEYVQLIVSDTGRGIEPQVIQRVFEPFFTTKKTGEGTGMGLAVVYGIVQSLDGTITVESEPGEGSTFRVCLPAARTGEPVEEAERGPIPRGSERILFVDDEEALTEWGQTTLERLGYIVTALTDSMEALTLFSDDPSRFDAVILDQTMPALTGLNLALNLLEIRPDIPIILCTGHSASVSPKIAKEAGIKGFLMKPLSKQELAVAIRRVLDTKSEA
ncbi:MAG TPA: PAS domain S-box protein [Syntrophorhabdaceae bacterium]